MIRIWFNHWFSTAFHMVSMIKNDNKNNLYIIGTNSNIENVMKTVCDYWEEEPEGLNDEEYLDYALNFCKKHSVNVFIPRKKQILIVKNIAEFDKIDVKVLADRNFDKMKLLNNKKSTYELFEKLGIGHIPEYYIANSKESFVEAYKKLKNIYNKICFKFIEDEGAVSFRIIDDTIEEADIFSTRKGLKVTSKEVYKSLEKRKSIPDIILMPYLEGTEVSVDCLVTEKGLIAIPRFKTHTRTEIIKYNKEILNICRDFAEKYGLEHPYNIQFKYSNGIPYLLEINTRMSGGLHYTCLASGINIPSIAVNQLLGINNEWTLEEKEKRVSYIETPVLI